MPSIKAVIKNCEEGLYHLSDVLKCLALSVPADATIEDFDFILSKYSEESKKGYMGPEDLENLLLLIIYASHNIEKIDTVLENPTYKRYIKRKAKEHLNSEHMFRYFISEKTEDGNAQDIEYFKSMSLDVEEAIGKVDTTNKAFKNRISSPYSSEIL